MSNRRGRRRRGRNNVPRHTRHGGWGSYLLIAVLVIMALAIGLARLLPDAG